MIPAWVNDFAAALRNKETSLTVLSGNVYDSVLLGGHYYNRIEDFIKALTGGESFSYDYVLRFNLYDGPVVVFGEEKKLIKDLGIAEKSGLTAEDQALAASQNLEPRLPADPSLLFGLLREFWKKSKDRMIFIVQYADEMFPNDMAGAESPGERALRMAVKEWARDAEIRENGHTIVFLSRHFANLHKSLRDRELGVKNIRIPKPDLETRKNIFKNKGFSDELLEIAAKASAGLSINAMESIFGKGAGPYRGKSHTKDSLISAIFAVKKKILEDECGNLLEIIEPKQGFEAIGGLEKPIAKLRRIARAIREGKYALVPLGILLMGPAGTGKSLLATAYAKEAGLTFLRIKNTKSQWVGESERQTEMVYGTMRDYAPVVAFIDEVDQNQRQRGGWDGDSGVSAYLFKMMLEVMSDPGIRGQILFIMATNRPDLLDPAMKRPGRCDLRIPLLPADEEQLQKICCAAFRQFPEMKTKIKNWRPYVKKCRGYTGADMIEVVRRAWEHAAEEDREEIGPKDMEFGCQDFRPQKVDERKNAAIAVLALDECSSLSLMPDNWEELHAYYSRLARGEKDSAEKEFEKETVAEDDVPLDITKN